MHKTLNLGDQLYRQKGLVQHAGAYIGNGQVIHSKPLNGTQVTSLKEFADGKQLRRRKGHTSPGVIERAQEMVGQPYHLLNGNCEHLANYVAFGSSHSPQLKAAALGGVLGLMTKSDTHWAAKLAIGCVGGLVTLALMQSSSEETIGL